MYLSHSESKDYDTNTKLINKTHPKKNKTNPIYNQKKKKKLEGPNLTPSPGRVQAAIMIN